MEIRNVLTAVLFSVLVVTSSAWAKKPVIDTSDSSQMTIDGLYPVVHSRLDEAFAKPDLDLSEYAKVMIATPDIAYRKRSSELSDEQAVRMIRYFHEAVTAELEDGGYSLVETAGTDVLLIEANIVDLMINRPTEPSIGRTTVFTATSGEMTLIGELKDSTSGEILARFADRNRPRSYWSQSTVVSEWSEVRRAFKFWAGILGDRLNAFNE
ncbi:MAG: DUF3313 family protein [Woeseiaceae bacterium]|nr:DUF3313 family protein [Woeseiaceae bacterium]